MADQDYEFLGTRRVACFQRPGWERLTEFERETRLIYRAYFDRFKPPAKPPERNVQWGVPMGRRKIRSLGFANKTLDTVSVKVFPNTDDTEAS